MQKHLVEIKARSNRHAEQRELLLAQNAEFRGLDHQIDHYFNAPTGRLKLRSGTIEHSLIAYARADQTGPKDSRVTLTKLPSRVIADQLAATLDAALGTWVVVDKQREIYFIGNVKFHLDAVAGLGTFVEIEAIGETDAEREELLAKCRHYMTYLGVEAEQLEARSYSDLLGGG